MGKLADALSAKKMPVINAWNVSVSFTQSALSRIIRSENDNCVDESMTMRIWLSGPKLE